METVMCAHKTGKPWAAGDFEEIRQMVAGKTPIRTICAKLGRTQAAVYRKASQMGISLRPAQGPFKARPFSAQELQQRFSPDGPLDLSLCGLLFKMNRL
jgi:hypothetical protein